MLSLTISDKDYEEFLGKWNEAGFTEQPPAIVGEPRWTKIQTVCRYTVIESEILEYKEKDEEKNILITIS